MLLAVGLIPALLVGMFLGYQLKRGGKRDLIENLKEGGEYRFFAGGGKILNYHYVAALIPLDDPKGIPKWFSCARPLPPGGHTYLKAVRGPDGKIVLVPRFKAVFVQVPIPLKA